MADKNTLNGALEEVGKLMATNLTTKGVPSTYDEGLTTLAGKILDIQGGGSSFDGISLTSVKDIISYYDEESATLTAQLLDGTSPAHVAGETVTFEVRKASDDSLVETLTGTTNSSGIATVSYLGKGVGDINIQAISRTFVSKTFVVHDCWYGNTGASVGSLEIDSGVSCTSNGSYITITKNTNGERHVKLPKTLSNTDNWIFETEIASIGTAQSLGVIFNDADWYGGYSDGYSTWQSYTGTRGEISQAINVGDVYSVKYENGTITVKLNDTVIQTRQVTTKSSFKVGYYTNNGRTQHLKNIMLKPL